MQLALPLLTALASGSPSGVSAGLALAAVGFFLAHEPVLILLGQRGPEVERTSRIEAALVLLMSAGVSALVLGAMWMHAPALRLLVSAPLSLGIVSVFISTASKRALTGQLMAAVVLPGWCLPIAVAGGRSVLEGCTYWLIFGTTFAVTAIVGGRER